MRKLLITIFITITGSFLVACSTTDTLNDKMRNAADNLPGIYKTDVRQGNVLTQKVIDRLRPGMDKRQVKFLLGTPLLADPFHKNRWDYFYNMKTAGKQTKQERLTVIFENEKLVSLKGNFKPSNNNQPMTIDTKVVDVPKREQEEIGFFERALRAMGIEYEEQY